MIYDDEITVNPLPEETHSFNGAKSIITVYRDDGSGSYTEITPTPGVLKEGNLVEFGINNRK